MSISRMEPLLPARRGDLEDLALEVHSASARLAGRVHPVTAGRLMDLLRNVNSYYSNRIEGIRTTLRDIEAGLAALSEEDDVRRLQLLHRANITAQKALERDPCNTPERLASAQALCRLHELLFKGVPEEFLVQRTLRGERARKVIPGTLRDEEVQVGDHVPPSPWEIPEMLARFEHAYTPGRLHGAVCMVAAAAAHHRLLWIHPFLEGNGRVARLFTDLYLRCIGVAGYGLWNMSRGFARHESRYKALLAAADAPRRGAYDGRGVLSEEGLRTFCRYFLETALDQATYMDSILRLDAAAKNIALYCTLRTEGQLAGRQPLPSEAKVILPYVFVHGRLEKGAAPALINASERKAREIVKTLLAEGLLESEHRKAPLTIGLPVHAVRFYLPELCDPEAFAGS
jgi:Fic family protein